MGPLKTKLFADGADIETIRKLSKNPNIKGFTTNPSLMRKSGIENYEEFSREVLKVIPNLPVSLEVFADEPDDIEKQAYEIASWGRNVYVKVPVLNTKGEFLGPLIGKLSDQGIALNITAVMTLEQVSQLLNCLSRDTPSIISVFAGRIADTGVDPFPLMKEALKLIKESGKNVELLWASPRELLNIIQADEMGCNIITATNDILNKLSLVGKDLNEYSIETVQMFYNDAQASGYKIKGRSHFQKVA